LTVSREGVLHSITPPALPPLHGLPVAALFDRDGPAAAVLYLVSDCFHTGPGVDIYTLGLVGYNDDAGSGLVCSTIDYMLSPLSSPMIFYILVEGFGFNEGSFQL
jgi:hypothetical protein